MRKLFCVALAVSTSMLACNVFAGSFGFQRQTGQPVSATARATVTLNMADDDDDPGLVQDDSSANQSATASASQAEPNFVASGTAQAASEADINVVTNSTAFNPTLDTSAVYQVTASNENGPPARSLAQAVPQATATFLVTDDETEQGTFEGQILLASAGDEAPGLNEFFDLTATITVDGQVFTVNAVRNGANTFTVTTTTPSGTVTTSTASPNESLFVTAPVSPGDTVTMETTVNLGMLEGLIAAGNVQGQRTVELVARGYAAALLGDFNDDGIVNSSDSTVWQNSFGQTVSPGTGADGNGDGIVNGADYLILQRHFGETSGN